MSKLRPITYPPTWRQQYLSQVRRIRQDHGSSYGAPPSSDTVALAEEFLNALQTEPTRIVPMADRGISFYFKRHTGERVRVEIEDGPDILGVADLDGERQYMPFTTIHQALAWVERFLDA